MVCDYCGTEAYEEDQMVNLGGMLACPECALTADEMGLTDLLG